MLNIIDSFLDTIHLPIGKFLKGAESVRSLVEPLLWNSGYCDAKATLPLYPVYDDENPAPEKEAEPEFSDPVRKSRKGPLVLGIIVLAVLLLLAVILGILGLIIWGIIGLF